MVMQADVVNDAYESIKDSNAKVIYMSPQGKVLNQKKVEQLSKEEHLIILCGHYEGIDQRVIDKIVDEEISIGDYVLTGGEIPAMVLIDSVSRYVDGVLSKDSISEESFAQGILEYPQYTRPEIFCLRLTILHFLKVLVFLDMCFLKLHIFSIYLYFRGDLKVKLLER